MASASGTVRRFGAVIKRLCTDFPTIQTQVVERTVVIAVDCAEHLGYAVTDDLVEGLVAESLRAKVATLTTMRKRGEAARSIPRRDYGTPRPGAERTCGGGPHPVIAG